VRGALAGIGAASLVDSVLQAFALELWFERVIESVAGPPHFERFDVPGYAVGAILALAIGGPGALLGLIFFAGLGSAFFVFRAAEWFFLGISPTFIPAMDFVIPGLWPFAGMALGSIVWAIWRPRGFRPEPWLRAVGVYAIAVALWGFAYIFVWDLICVRGQPPGCVAAGQVPTAVWSVVLGLALGILLARRTDLRAVIAVAVVIALPSAVVVVHQGSTAGGTLAVLELGRGIVTGAVAVATALLLVSRWRLPRPAATSS
jgi:hypothetical protein